MIGDFSAGGSHFYYNGIIDELRVWNSVLTDLQIQNNLYHTLDRATSGLTAYYRFDQNTGAILYDLTDNHHDGTIVNPMWTDSYAMIAPITQAASDVQTTSFTAHWTAPETGIPIHYLLDVSADSNFNTIVEGYWGLDCGTNLSQPVSGLHSGTTYYYRVRADKNPITLQGAFYRNSTSLTTEKASQSIDFITITSPVTLGVSPITLSATATSGLEVTFTSDNPAVATVSGNTLTILEGGKVTITASQPGNTNYNPATPVSQTLTINMTQPGNALTFTPANTSVVNCGNLLSSATAFTMEGWIKPESNVSSSTVFAAKNTGCTTGGFALYINKFGTEDQSLVIESDNCRTLFTADNAIQMNKWQHIAIVVFNNSSAKLYINGAEQTTTGEFQYSDLNIPVVLGDFSGGSHFSYKGAMDEVRIWNFAMSETELRNNLYQSVNASSSNLLAYYKFNQSSGDTLYDETSNANDAAIQNCTFTESYAMVVPTPQAATTIDTTSFMANWTAPETGIAEKYLLDVSTTSDFATFVGAYAGYDCGTNLSQIVSGLTPGTTYYYRIRAEKSSVTGAGGFYRNSIPVTTKQGQSISFSALTSPVNITLSSISLSATASSGLDVSYSVDNESVATISGNILTLVGEGTVNITAQQNGNSVYSAAANVVRTLVVLPNQTTPGNALKFNPDNSNFISCGSILDAAGAFTIEAWIKPDSSFGPMTVFASKYTGCTAGGFALYINSFGTENHALVIENDYCQTLYTDAGAIKMGIWQHIAMVVSSSNSAKLYINGTEQTVYGAYTTTTLAAPFTIGDFSGGGSHFYYKGNMDEVRVWNSALSSTQLQSNMRDVINPSTAGLTAYYRFDQTNGNTLYDLTADHHDGTVVNPLWVESYAMVVPTANSASDTSFTSFTANWAVPAVGTVEKYLLDVSTTSDFSSFVGAFNGYHCGTNLSQTVTGLSPNTTYYYRVRAEKTSVTGQGNYSNIISLKTTAITPTANILYITHDGAGIKDGSSWANAFDGGNYYNNGSKLQYAINNMAGGTQIWVAAGMYYPCNHGDRGMHFSLKEGVKLYGGFAGTETDLSQRKITSNASILNGNIGDINTNTDNSYHVVYNSGDNLTPATVIDGFTISDGYANAGNFGGGGLYFDNVAPTISNCIIKNNWTSDNGGGLFITSSNGSVLSNNLICFNTSSQGGGINILNGSIFISNSILSNNASDYGGGIYTDNAQVNIRNSIVWGNTATYGKQLLYFGGSYSLFNTCYSNGSDDITGPGPIILGSCTTSNPLFTDAVNGDFHLLTASPCINTGDNSYNTETNDLDGNPRIVNTTIDMGAYEYDGPPNQVYVDDSWAGTTNGTTPANSSPAGLIFGINAFATLQDAIDSVVAGGTVTVYGGAYPDPVEVNKALNPIQIATNPNIAGEMTVAINGAVTLSAATTFLSSDATNLTFGNTVDGGQSLIINSPNTVTFTGIIGGVSPLASLITDAPGTTILDLTSVAGAVLDFNDAVVVEQDAILTGTTSVDFDGTINSAADEANDLTVNSPTTGFHGIIGGAGNGALGSLRTDAAGMTTFDLASVSGGVLDFNDVVVVEQDMILTGTTSVDFDSPINSAAGETNDLTVNSPTTGFQGIIGGEVNGALGSLMTDAAGSTQINGGSVTTTGNQTYGDAVIFGGATGVTTTTGHVTFNYSVTGPAGLTVNSGGNVEFNGGTLDGSLSVTANSVQFGYGTLNVGTTVAITAAGAISNDANGGLAVTGNATFINATTVDLGNQAGDSMKFGSLTFNSVGTASITEDDATSLTGINTLTSLALHSGGAMTEIAGTSLTVSGNLNVADGSGAGITLDQTNNVGTLTFTSSGTVVMAEASEINLVGINNAGTFTLTPAATVLTPVPTVFAENGATLNGAGTVNGILSVSTGGVIKPNLNGAHVITVTNNLIMNNGSQFIATVDGAGTGAHDWLNITGSVVLNGASLSLSGSITSSPGQVIVLIANDGVDPVVGTFNGIPEASTVFINGLELILSYHGGSNGNDVVLIESGFANTNGSAGSDDFELRRETGADFDVVQLLKDGAVFDSRPISVVAGWIINGGNGADGLLVNYGYTGGFFNTNIYFNGQNPIVGGMDDVLSIAGGSFTNVTHSYGSAGTSFGGTLNYNNGSTTGLITYSGVGSVDMARTDDTDPLTPDDSPGASMISSLILNLPGTNDLPVLEDDGTSGNQVSKLSSTGNTFASTTFPPANTLTVNMGGDDGSLTVSSLSDFGNTLKIDGQSGADAVSFTGTVSLFALTVTTNGNMTNAAGANLTVANSTNFTGGIIDIGIQAGDIVNFGSLTFQSASAVNISEDSDMSLEGTNTANNLTLTPFSTVYVEYGATLNGAGTVNGILSVNNGGTVNPGSSGIGTLTTTHSPVLSGTLNLQLSKNGTTLTSDKLIVNDALTFGSTLTVTAGGDALAGGDLFDLFDAGSFSGEFSTQNLPALPAGWLWNVSNLPVDGTIVIQHPPVIAQGASVSVTMSEDGYPTAWQTPTITATDPGGDSLTWSLNTAAIHGTATVSGTGASPAITYAPNPNYNGTDSFVVRVAAIDGMANITVNVTIEAVDDPPAAITNAASNISSAGATLNASVNPNELTTAVRFEYGLTTAYDNTIDASPDTLSGNTLQDVIANLGSLTAGTNYHFRVVAVNSAGTTNGADQTFTTPLVVNPTAGILYVTPNGAGLQDGTSWANAFDGAAFFNHGSKLQYAINNLASGKQIWVAAGTYYPCNDGDRTISFNLKDGVELYGGFAGTETSVTERNLTTNNTILSGDLNGDDDYSTYPWTNIVENSYHVIYNYNGLGLSNTAILDGFTISGGNANATSEIHMTGGGVYSNNNSETYRNINISHNRAYDESSNNGSGGGMYIQAANPVIINVSILSNVAGSGGGGIYINGGSPTITNCLIASNSASKGGGLRIISLNQVFTNVAIVNNQASQGGGIYYSKRIDLQNSILWGNSAISSGHQAFSLGGGELNSLYLYSSCYSNQSGDYSVDVSVIPDAACITTNPRFVDTTAGDFRILNISPCADAGNDSYCGEITDIRGAGFARKLLKTNHNQVGTIDMGAYEYKEGTDPACNNPSNGGTISPDQTICTGTTPLMLNHVSAPTGYSGILAYKWQSQIIGGNYTDIVDSDAATYAPGILTETTRFKRLARVTCQSDWTGAAESNVVTITVEQPPVSGTLTKTPDVSTVCEGGLVSAVVTSGTGGNSIDSSYFRTNNGTSWSVWANYVSGTNITTVNKTNVEIRTKRKAASCGDAAFNTVSWIVNPGTSAGSVTGGTAVCSGTNSTVITLSGHTGAVQRWQSSVNTLNWLDISGQSGTTLLVENLVQATSFRAVVKSGTCQEMASGYTSFTISNTFTVSGTARYENNPQTPLNGIKLVLCRFVSGSVIKVDSTVTSSLGSYEFAALSNGTYGLQVKSAHPSGLWQTWSGVNNTDALLVNNHIAGTSLLPVNPPVIRIAASTKIPHPQIQNNDYLAIRQAAKLPSTGWQYFDIPKWVFPGITAATPIDTFQISCSGITRDIRGLCAGDVNGTYVPSTGYKIVEPTLVLINRGILPVTDEIVFPIRVVGTHSSASLPMEIGAITLMLDYNPALIDITAIEMPDNGGETPFYSTDNGVLSIGWMSLNPISVNENEPLLFIRARVRTMDTFLQNPTNIVRFTLNSNPLSELADGDGMVIDGAKLSVSDAGMPAEAGSRAASTTITIYPNPAKELLNIKYELTSDAKVQYSLLNMQGMTVIQSESVWNKTGWHHEQVNVQHLSPGVYHLKMTVGEETVIKKVVVW